MTTPMICTPINARTHAALVEMARIDAIMRKSRPAKDPSEDVVVQIATRMIRKNGGRPFAADGWPPGRWSKPLSDEDEDGERVPRGRAASAESERSTMAALAFMRAKGRPVSSVELAVAGVYKTTEQGSMSLNWLVSKGVVRKLPMTPEYRKRHPEAANCKCLWEPVE